MLRVLAISEKKKKSGNYSEVQLFYIRNIVRRIEKEFTDELCRIFQEMEIVD